MAAAEQTRVGAGSRNKARILSIGLCVIFGLLLVVLFVRTAQVAITRPPTFDGAMNMQVASSIADGEGYRRNYAAREAFPHEIQTGVPYILPSAAVFKIWNVGIPQAEVANLLYLALLLAMIYLLVVPLGGRALALFAACSVLAVPGVHEYGLYGYGEIPALFFVLAATVVYFRSSKTHGLATGFAAGVLLALAFYTKTVMLIGIGSLCLCAVLEWWWSRNDERRSASRRFLALLAGGAVSIIVMETWRAIAVGGFHAWRVWWRSETRNVFMQAGVSHAYGNFTHSLSEKFGVHFADLSHDYRMSLVLTGLWLLLLLLAVLATILRPAARRGKWATLTVLVIAFVYMLWWLLITPTAKAWHRRVIDGMICADVGLVMFVAVWCKDRFPGLRSRFAQVSVLVLAALGLALPLMWLAKGSHTLLAGQVSEKTCGWRMVDADACAKFSPGGSVAALRRTAREVRALPANAYIFGIGWYSAPRVGLLSERHMLDINDVPVARLQPGRPVYFVQGPDTPPAQLQRIRLLYGMTGMRNFGYALIPMASMTPVPLVPGSAPVRRHIQAADHYAYLRGFNGSEGANGRWLSADNLILLTPSAGDRFEVVAYVLPVSRYEYDSAPRVIVSFNGCAASPQQTTPGSVTLFFAIPAQCAVTPGKPVNVRIEVDNLVNIAITLDQRPLGILGKSLGFVSAAAEQSPTPRQGS